MPDHAEGLGFPRPFGGSVSRRGLPVKAERRSVADGRSNEESRDHNRRKFVAPMQHGRRRVGGAHHQGITRRR